MHMLSVTAERLWAFDEDGEIPQLVCSNGVFKQDGSKVLAFFRSCKQHGRACFGRAMHVYRLPDERLCANSTCYMQLTRTVLLSHVSALQYYICYTYNSSATRSKCQYTSMWQRHLCVPIRFLTHKRACDLSLQFTSTRIVSHHIPERFLDLLYVCVYFRRSGKADPHYTAARGLVLAEACKSNASSHENKRTQVWLPARFTVAGFQWTPNSTVSYWFTFHVCLQHGLDLYTHVEHIHTDVSTRIHVCSWTQIWLRTSSAVAYFMFDPLFRRYNCWVNVHAKQHVYLCGEMHEHVGRRYMNHETRSLHTYMPTVGGTCNPFDHAREFLVKSAQSTTNACILAYVLCCVLYYSYPESLIAVDMIISIVFIS